MENRVGVGFGVMVLKDGKVLLGQRHHDPEKAKSALHGEGTWTMPGGKLRFGETFMDGARRELEEETGMSLTLAHPITVQEDIVSDAHFVTVGMLAKAEGEPRALEPEEITRWAWFSLNALPEPLFEASKKIIEKYVSGEIMGGKNGHQ